MSQESGAAHEFEARRLSRQALNDPIAALEAERETVEARRLVVRRRIALLRAERVARARNAHFDAEAVAEALLRRLPGLVRGD
jgi:hypothetical protein